MTTDENIHHSYSKDWWKRDRAPEETPVEAVVLMIAALENREVSELPPLYDTVDPDAINALFIADQTHDVLQLRFRYCGYEIEVDPISVRVRSVE